VVDVLPEFGQRIELVNLSGEFGTKLIQTK
jgi:hypothetical protein